MFLLMNLSVKVVIYLWNCWRIASFLRNRYDLVLFYSLFVSMTRPGSNVGRLFPLIQTLRGREVLM